MYCGVENDADFGSESHSSVTTNAETARPRKMKAIRGTNGHVGKGYKSSSESALRRLRDGNYGVGEQAAILTSFQEVKIM